ncbi:phage tail tape mesure [Liquorilactobacillus aquaticus DSM 21051]|uniref:Phage tail tape mesure n=1 Tax=Liquorilactobacillus aquaticus DSM 21051 TaxID=1423725 RepID=A0A0R2CXH1_9LACO|nr:tape measure protein [Liquorilactobacillus aquaticus]KRM95954.1 phage tail tape mesure [Liquorilactobacillus aquaticus DSM 21051]
MTANVQYEMATRVAINTVSAVGSLKGLKDAVSAATNAWKAQETALKSSGDAIGAAQTRFNGLGDVIDRQKAKINELKSRQNGLDKTTQEGAESYLKLQKQIDSSTKQLASLEAQQTRAKSSMTYYASGLADLQKGYRQSNELSKSFVERLQAEGKAEEANRAKMSGLKQSLSNLSSQYSKQQEELKRVASESGATSDAYKRQQVRLNETGTAMAKTKTEMNELRESMNKKPSSFMDGIKGRLTDVNEKAEKTSHLFGTILGAHLVANGITNVLASVQAHFSELKDAVVEYDNKQQVMASTWDTLTGSHGKGQQMVDISNHLSAAYNQSINVVDELDQQFYHVFDNAPRTETLTKSILTMSDTLGLSADNTKRLGTNFTHMLSSSKMQLGDFNMIQDQLPMYGEKLLEYEREKQKNHKLTMSQLRDEMSAGKVSADDAETVMNELGKKYQSASENLMKTGPGMVRSIKTQSPALLDALYEPIRKMKNPFIGQISHWIQDSDTKKEFKAVGDAFQMQINDIITAFAGNSKKVNLGDGLTKGLFNLQTGIDKLGATIVAHKDQIKELFSSMKTASKTSFSVLVQTLKDLEPVLQIVGQLASDHPKTFAAIAANGLLASKAISGLAIAFKGLDVMKGTASTLGGIAKRLVFKPKIDGATGKKELSLFAKGVKGIALGVGKGLKWTASIVTKGAQLAMTGLLKTAKITGSGIKLAFNFLKANPFILIVTAIAAVIAALVELYKHNAKFRAFVNSLIKAAQNAWKNVTKFFKVLWKDSIGAIENMYKGVTGWLGNMKKGMEKHASEAWKNTKSAFSDGWNNVKNWTSDGASKISSGFSNMKKWTIGHAKDMWSSHKGTFKDGYSVLQNYTQTWHDVMTGKWGKVGSDLKNVANSINKFMRDVFTGMYNKLNDLTGGRLGDVLNTFKSIFGKIHDVVSGAIDKVHHAFTGIVRGVLKPFNSMLSGLKKGINWVLDKVGADKIGASWSVPMPSYATGTKDTHQGGLAMVNDAPGTNYREMFHLPTGEIGMFPKDRNIIVPLPKGTSVLDGDRSASLAKMLGVPAYKSGIGSFFSSMWNKGKDILDDVDKILAHPIDFMEGVFKKFTNGISSKAGMASDIITHFPGTVAKSAVKWVKKMFEDMGDSGNPGGSGVTRWKDTIKKAAAKMHVDLSGAGMNAVLHRIAQESNGNPTVTNNWDSNAKAGTPSKGLLQYIQPTLSSWVPKGVKANLASGWSQLTALFNDSNWLSDISVKGGWGPTGHKRMANGGIVSTNQMIEVAEGNKKEMVIPMVGQSSRAWSLLKEVIDNYADGQLNSQNVVSKMSDQKDEQVEKLKNKVEDVSVKFDQLLSLMKQQIDATKGIGTFDQQAKYRQQGLDQSMSDMQAI